MGGIWSSCLRIIFNMFICACIGLNTEHFLYVIIFNKFTSFNLFNLDLMWRYTFYSFLMTLYFRHLCLLIFIVDSFVVSHLLNSFCIELIFLWSYFIFLVQIYFIFQSSTNLFEWLFSYFYFYEQEKLLFYWSVASKKK